MYLQKVISINTFEIKFVFCWYLEGQWRKIAGSGSGSMSQRHGYALRNPARNTSKSQQNSTNAFCLLILISMATCESSCGPASSGPMWLITCQVNNRGKWPPPSPPPPQPPRFFTDWSLQSLPSTINPTTECNSFIAAAKTMGPSISVKGRRPARHFLVKNRIQ